MSTATTTTTIYSGLHHEPRTPRAEYSRSIARVTRAWMEGKGGRKMRALVDTRNGANRDIDVGRDATSCFAAATK
ncbi:hypothetical protein V498_10205, partial [Pseudogymnoascus sp. VKM F-4517 (FW-2822)]